MVEVGTHRFVIESTQFAKLERALSVTLPAARSLGIDAGIFWLRDSIFAATPYASIGLASCDLELEESPGCIAISQLAARPLLFELRAHRVRYLERIDFVVARDRVVFSFEYDRKSKVSTPPLFSRYSSSWCPRLTPREYYEILAESCPNLWRALPIEKIRAKLLKHEDYGYVFLEDFSRAFPQVAVSRSLLVAFLEAAKSEDTTFLFAYYEDKRSIVCRVGDVIAILSVID